VPLNQDRQSYFARISFSDARLQFLTIWHFPYGQPTLHDYFGSRIIVKETVAFLVHACGAS
jgi:hypothetical protein